MKLLDCKNVLIITASFSRNKLAESERVYYLVKTLLKFGVAVTVLTSKCSDNYKLSGNITVIDEIPEPLFKLGFLNRVISPIADGLLPTFFLKRKVLENSIQGNFDMVISSSPPHSIHYIGFILSRKLNAPFVVDLRDAWKHNKLVKYGTVIHRYLSNWIYRKILNKADTIIANTPALKELIIKDGFSSEVLSVPNGYPRDSFNNISSNTTVPKHQKLKILYSGGHYGGKAIDIISKLLPKNNLYTVDFLGEAFTPVRGCNYIGKVSSHEVPPILLSYDVLIIYMPPKEKASARVLLKAYGYAKSGKDIIYVGPKNATYDLLNSMSNVYHVDEKDMEFFSELLEKLDTNRSSQGINEVDFSFEFNFENLIKRDLCLKTKSY